MSSKRRILLAEDDASVLKMTTLRLQHEGFEVVVAMDGEQAVKNASSGNPVDLILIDVKMPKLDGLQVCKQLKNSPTTAKIPIIVFTASMAQWQQLADRCVELGVTDWLKKPFRSQELLSKIHHALGKEGQPHG